MPVDDEEWVRTYVIEATQAPVLDAAAEVDLGRLIQAGRLGSEIIDRGLTVDGVTVEHVVSAARQATQALLAANRRLVVAIAKRYATEGTLSPGLIERGERGLTTAVERWDPRDGRRFSVYATWFIRQAMRAAA